MKSTPSLNEGQTAPSREPSGGFTDADVALLQWIIDDEKRRWLSYQSAGSTLHVAAVERLRDKVAGVAAPTPDPRELLCMICNRDYPVWCAPNDLWNRVVRLPDGSDRWQFLCPNCFAVKAEECGAASMFWLTDSQPRSPASVVPPSERQAQEPTLAEIRAFMVRGGASWVATLNDFDQAVADLRAGNEAKPHPWKIGHGK